MAPNAEIGERANIGENVRIGFDAGVGIMPPSVIGNDCTIGDEAVLEADSRMGDGCTLVVCPRNDFTLAASGRRLAETPDFTGDCGRECRSAAKVELQTCSSDTPLEANATLEYRAHMEAGLDRLRRVEGTARREHPRGGNRSALDAGQDRRHAGRAVHRHRRLQLPRQRRRPGGPRPSRRRAALAAADPAPSPEHGAGQGLDRRRHQRRAAPEARLLRSREGMPGPYQHQHRLGRRQDVRPRLDVRAGSRGTGRERQGQRRRGHLDRPDRPVPVSTARVLPIPRESRGEPGAGRDDRKNPTRTATRTGPGEQAHRLEKSQRRDALAAADPAPSPEPGSGRGAQGRGARPRTDRPAEPARAGSTRYTDTPPHDTAATPLPVPHLPPAPAERVR